MTSGMSEVLSILCLLLDSRIILGIGTNCIIFMLKLQGAFMSATKLNQVLIKKASGKMEDFDVAKLRLSLKRAGAKNDAIDEVVSDIENWVYDGVSTSKIYARAYRLFRQKSKAGALLYKLKQAINEMGPTGFPFEHFIGELFKIQGYSVEVSKVIEGNSVCHEMDVIAIRGKEQILGECKYSHKQGSSVGVQVPLYVHSRVDDIIEKLLQKEQYKDTRFVAWIFTNGRFSPDSIEYSRCKGINLMGWDYPAGKALKDFIEKEMMFPVTILSSLSKSNKAKLMGDGVVTCKQLANQPDILEQLGLEADKQGAVIKELQALAEYGESQSE